MSYYVMYCEVCKVLLFDPDYVEEDGIYTVDCPVCKEPRKAVVEKDLSDL
jgi:hypothetical protein